MEHEKTIKACSRHLQALSEALNAYRQDHQELPPQLSDLYPTYLSRKKEFRCPAHSIPPGATSKSKGVSSLPISYDYEMSAEPVPPYAMPLLLGPQQPQEKLTWRDIKALQQLTYGDRVPIVRCRHHNGTVLNLTQDGQIYRSQGVWEHDPATIQVVLERLRQDLSAGAEVFFRNWLPSAVAAYVNVWIQRSLPPALRRQLHLTADYLMHGMASLPETSQPEIARLAALFYAAAGQSAQALAACDVVLAQPGNYLDVAFLQAKLQRATGQTRGAPPVLAYLKAAMASGPVPVPGLSVGVIHQGKLSLAQGLGQANVECATPATADTVYQLASVTKQFTATATMMLVEEGKVTLDEPIAHILPDLPAAWNGVTVRHLLTHTSGIKSYTSIPDLWKLARLDYTQEEILKLIADAPLEFTPGEKYAYNNTGYFLLGMIIEKISGQTYAEFLTERIFTPLGMSTTRINDLKEILPNRATGYTRIGSALRHGEYCSPTWPYAAGALVSTVRDLAKWDAALATEQLLTKSSLEPMWTPFQLNDGNTSNYGFGWGLGTWHGHRLVCHGGGIPGFATFIVRFLEAGLTVVALANLDNTDIYTLSIGVARLYLPKPKTLKTGDAATQRQHRQVLLSLMGEGPVDTMRFSETGQQELLAQIEPIQAFYRSLGPLKSFRLIEQTNTENDQTYCYWTELGDTAWIHTFHTTREGTGNREQGTGNSTDRESKIEKIMIEPG